MKPKANAPGASRGAAKKSSEIISEQYPEDTRSTPKFQDLALVVSLEKYVTRQIAIRQIGRGL